MGSKLREKLQEQLGKYISDTLTYIETVKEFCDGEPSWIVQRETELSKVKDFKGPQVTGNSRKQKLEKELAEVLKNTLEGLQKLHQFLDAVEKLAITSLFIFKNESLMPKSLSAKHVQLMISSARIVSPLLLCFKRNAKDFFLPNLSNVEVLAFQLDKYIRVTQQICKKVDVCCHYEESPSLFLCRPFGSLFGGKNKWKNGKLSLKFGWRKSTESVQKLYDHLIQLIKLRMDESFRLTFLFGVKAQHFINIFSERHSRMLQFLSDLDEAADQLDKMKKGSNISSVAGSSVGIAGGVCSIVGLALAPVTAGVSLALTLTAAGLGVTSGVNSLVTGVTETAVNSYQGVKANEIFVRFMEDLQDLLELMGQVANIEGSITGLNGVNMEHEARRFGSLGQRAAKGIAEFVDVASTATTVKNEEVIRRACTIGLKSRAATQNIPKLAADLPDIAEMAKGTSVTLSKSARVGLIGLNALFIGLDVFSIYKGSVSLAKGSKNEVAQLIRSRSVLWRSEVEACKKIHDHLCDGISTFEENREILQQPLYL